MIRRCTYGGGSNDDDDDAADDDELVVVVVIVVVVIVVRHDNSVIERFIRISKTDLLDLRKVQYSILIGVTKSRKDTQ